MYQRLRKKNVYKDLTVTCLPATDTRGNLGSNLGLNIFRFMLRAANRPSNAQRPIHQTLNTEISGWLIG